jgi:hypothetical protein
VGYAATSGENPDQPAKNAYPSILFGGSFCRPLPESTPPKTANQPPASRTGYCQSASDRRIRSRRELRRKVRRAAMFIARIARIAASARLANLRAYTHRGSSAVAKPAPSRARPVRTSKMASKQWMSRQGRGLPCGLPPLWNGVSPVAMNLSRNSGDNATPTIHDSPNFKSCVQCIEIRPLTRLGGGSSH